MRIVNRAINRSFILFSIFLFLNIYNCYSDNPVIKEWKRKELTEDFKNHLCSLSEVYGYVRYFYPNENLKDLDWFNFLIYSIKEIEGCKSEKDFNQKLYQLFSPLCPEISINNNFSKSKHYSSGSFYIQEHSLLENGTFNSGIKDISAYSAEYPKPDSLYTFIINPQLAVSFPIALSELPKRGKQLTNLIDSCKNSWDEKSMYNLLASEPFARIANEIMRCNIVQHFYPYYFEDKLDVTWRKSYKDYFNKIANSNNSTSYYYLVCNMMNLVKDNHVNLNFNVLRALSTKRFPGIETVILDNKLLIKNVLAPYDSVIHRGDRIIKINNREAEAFIKGKLNNLSYSTLESGLTKLTSSNEIFSSYAKDSVLNLTMKNSEGKESEVAIKINLFRPAFVADKEFIKCFDGNEYYINLKDPQLISYDKFKVYIPEINKSKGVIFDMRGYPNADVFSILANITDSILSLGNLYEVHYYFPNHINSVPKPTEKWFIAPSMSAMNRDYSKKYQYPLPVNEKITVPCVFLVNSVSMSFMETVIDIIKNYKLGILIGENTAGCNGDTPHFKLPFASFSMTFAKFLNRDGSQHHGIGIKPDIYVENKDMNIDAQLEAAKKYLDVVASYISK